LPITADPAVLAAAKGAVVRRIIVHQFDIAGQPGASIGTLDQVMAEQGIFREPAVERAQESINLPDPLSGEDSIAIEVLVNVGNGPCIDVQSPLSGENVGQARPCRALQTDAQPRL